MPRAFPPLDEATLKDEFVVFCCIGTRWMNYVILEIVAGPVNGKGPVQFTQQGADSPLTFSTGLDDAQVFMYGSLKWDGCMDLTVGQGDDYQLHFCGRNSALIFQRVVERLYDIAAAHMSAFDPVIAS